MLNDTSDAVAISGNPLLDPWPGPFGGVPPWDCLRPELFPAAFEAALADQRRSIEAIAANPDPPTFDNTLVALERTGRALERVQRLFGVALQNVTTPAYQALEREWLPRLVAADDDIVFNRRLFARIESVYASRDRGLEAAQPSPEDQRLVTRTYDRFVRRGAQLLDAEAQRLSAINQELETRFSEFRAMVLADEDSWTVLHDEADLAGLPPSLVAAARAAASERGLADKFVIVNTRSSVDPFLTFSRRRDLREQVWKKFKSRADNADANDSNGTISRIVLLRAERARLLGFASHAHWRMADTMAVDPENARALLMRVWPAAVGRVREEVADMQAMAGADANGISSIEPWDYLHYAEQVRKQRYDLDQNEIKPYFALDNMVAAALWTAEQRYGITFTEISGRVPVFHPDVRVWEVTETADGRHRGLFYLDNFARTGKRSGAWASPYRPQRGLDGGVTAIASNNNNFVKGASGQPVLISLDDATTLFHEFGHALHYLLQDVRYPSLASTPRDYVEFPSQVNESWLLTREVLDRFACHYQTGAPMPQALVTKIKQSEKFNQGYATVEYLAAAIADMEMHTRAEGPIDMKAFEREILASIGMPREIALRHRLPHFDHLFGSDSYSAGYYSYLWADVMAADAWQAFLEASGPWDRDVAARLREHTLSDGNTSDRLEAYRRFRGRDPDVKALLEARGFPTP